MEGRIKRLIVTENKVYCYGINDSFKIQKRVEQETGLLDSDGKLVEVEAWADNPNSFFSDPLTWRYLAHNYGLHDKWFNFEEYFPKILKAVKEWQKDYVYWEENKFLNESIVFLDHDTEFFMKDSVGCVDGKQGSHIYIYGDSAIVVRNDIASSVYDTSTVKQNSNGEVELFDYSHCDVAGGGVVVCRDESAVDAEGYARVKVCGLATVNASGNSCVYIEHLPKEINMSGNSSGYFTTRRYGSDIYRKEVMKRIHIGENAVLRDEDFNKVWLTNSKNVEFSTGGKFVRI